MLFSHLRLGLETAIFPSGSITNNFYAFLISTMRATYPTPPNILDFITLITCIEAYNFAH